MISSLNHKNNRSDTMGRTTRVFGARVLRSGRRVWTGPPLQTIPDGKTNHCSRDKARGGAASAVAVTVNDDDELVELRNVDNESVGFHHYKQGKSIGPKLWNTGKNNADIGREMTMDIDEKRNVDEREPEPVFPKFEKAEQKKHIKEVVDRMYGIVYQRKRKRGQVDDLKLITNHIKDCGTDDKDDYWVNGDRVCIRQSVRRRMAGTPGDAFAPGCCDSKAHSELQSLGRGHRKLAVVVGSCASRCIGSISCYLTVSCLLNSLLRYMRRVQLGLQPLCAFICSEPFIQVYSVHGVNFVQDPSSLGKAGVCIISGASGSIPAFFVDFSALPFCFMHLHSSLLLQYAVLLCISETNSRSSYEEEDELNLIDECSSSLHSDGNQAGCEVVVSGYDNTGKSEVVQELGMPKVLGRAVQIKNGCKIQKRSSLRKRGRPPSIARMQQANGALASDLLTSRHDLMQLSPQVTTCQHRSIIRGNAQANVKEFKSTLVEVSQNIGAASCFANILVIQPDKGYRVEGALIGLELSKSSHWCLSVIKDGMKRYSFTAQKFMRPCSSNRFTHDTIWTRDNDWKLEFPNRSDWLIFRELYKVCYERNLQIPVPSAIPVPRVHEVQNYGEILSLRFLRPDYYITMKDDELARSLVRRTATYDMDSDDEDWLHKFNKDFNTESELHGLLSDESFELMIEAFEKAVHCNPEDFCNTEAAYSILPDIGRRAVEAVYSYWVNKRKLKRGALVRVFQCYQPRKAQPITTSIFRKKRSFKRQGNHAGRGKQRTFLHAIADEQDTAEQQNAILKLKEATAAASRTESLAVLKRLRAQQLMERADLAAYHAMMAFKIAEAAQLTGKANAAASLFLD